MDILELIRKVGGNAAFSREFKTPIKTIEGVKAGKCWPQHRVDVYAELFRRRREEMEPE